MQKSPTEVTNWVKNIFNKIMSAQAIREIEDLENNLPDKYRMKTTNYPMLKFSVSPSEIQELNNKGIVDKQGYFSDQIFNESKDTVTKLLIAMAWKNGDLQKIHHIINGILDNGDTNEKEGIVFRQFGRYLANKSEEPIIDQHVLRAFEIYQLKDWDEERINQCRKRDLVTHNQYDLINKYKSWLRNNIHTSLKKEENYTYHIDKLLFGVGKMIKYRNSKVKLNGREYINVTE